MNRKRVLLVSIAFPPKKDPECIQTGRYFYYLSKERKVHLDVLTSTPPTLFMPVDVTLTKYDQGWDEKIELRLLENKYFSYLQRKLWLSPLMLPDSKAHFHLQWKSAIKKISHVPNVIYSRSYPLSSSILGYRLSKHFKVPWVLHLSDPWVDSPLHNYSEKEKEYHSNWEEKCFRQAKNICLTSNKSIHFYSKKYPKYASKFKLFPNVFDPEEIVKNPYSPKEKLRLIYTGGLAGTRSPKTFLEALKDFNQRSEKSDLLEVIFAGPCDRRMRGVIDEFDLPNFNYVGALSLKESISLQRTADVLLIIDSNVSSAELAMFFPSKILEYVGAQRRIMALTTNGSATENVMEALNYDSLQITDTVAISSYLESLVDEFSNKNYSYFHIENIPQEFSAQHNAIRLAELFEEI